jgi:hypothetical protein
MGGYYEIIDGFHRFTACGELGYSKLPINDLGVISDTDARILLINREKAKIPLDPVKEAELIKELKAQFGTVEQLSGVLPYSVEVIEEKLKVLDFDWSSYSKTEYVDVKPKMSLTIKLTEAQLHVVREALNTADCINDSYALAKICQES